MVGLLIALLLASAGVVGRAVWIDTSLRRRGAAGLPRPAGAGRGTTWLLVGSDSRQGLTPEQQTELATGGDMGNGRTDTIMLVHVPAFGSGAPTTMVSIPRDSYVNIPGNGTDKINAAFATAAPHCWPRPSKQATGLRLDHYAEIGFGGFARVVDALGGVTVCPAEPINDPLAGIDLPAGCQKLDGRNALGYVRSRATPRADLDRMVNQREFMSALLHRAASPAVWLNPLRWYRWRTRRPTRSPSTPGDHVWDLARLGWALHGVDHHDHRADRRIHRQRLRVRSWCGTPTPPSSCSTRCESDRAPVPQDARAAGPVLSVARAGQAVLSQSLVRPG